MLWQIRFLIKLQNTLKLSNLQVAWIPTKNISEKTVEPKELGQSFLDKSKLFLGDDSVQTLLKEGICAESILKEAKDIEADTPFFDCLFSIFGIIWLNRKALSGQYIRNC